VPVSCGERNRPGSPVARASPMAAVGRIDDCAIADPGLGPHARWVVSQCEAFAERGALHCEPVVRSPAPGHGPAEAHIAKVLPKPLPPAGPITSNPHPPGGHACPHCRQRQRQKSLNRCGDSSVKVPVFPICSSSRGSLFIFLSSPAVAPRSTRLPKASPCPACVRPRGHAQAPAILDHSRALLQGDGDARPAFARRAVGGECDLIVLDAGDVLHDAFAVRSPCRCGR